MSDISTSEWMLVMENKHSAQSISQRRLSFYHSRGPWEQISRIHLLLFTCRSRHTALTVLTTCSKLISTTMYTKECIFLLMTHQYCSFLFFHVRFKNWWMCQHRRFQKYTIYKQDGLFPFWLMVQHILTLSLLSWSISRYLAGLSNSNHVWSEQTLTHTTLMHSAPPNTHTASWVFIPLCSAKCLNGSKRHFGLNDSHLLLSLCGHAEFLSWPH